MCRSAMLPTASNTQRPDCPAYLRPPGKSCGSRAQRDRRRDRDVRVYANALRRWAFFTLVTLTHGA